MYDISSYIFDLPIKRDEISNKTSFEQIIYENLSNNL